jgi:hypothetical protein
MQRPTAPTDRSLSSYSLIHSSGTAHSPLGFERVCLRFFLHAPGNQNLCSSKRMKQNLFSISNPTIDNPRYSNVQANLQAQEN